MKKIILSAIVMCFGIAVQAQTDRVVGVHFGMPMGDAADVSTFNLGVDARHLYFILLTIFMQVLQLEPLIL